MSEDLTIILLQECQKYLSETYTMLDNAPAEKELEKLSEKHVQAWLDIKKYIINKRLDKKYTVKYKKFRNIQIQLPKFLFDMSFHMGNHDGSYSEFYIIKCDDDETIKKIDHKKEWNYDTYDDTCKEIDRLVNLSDTKDTKKI